jgi:cold shock CspA family protein
MYTSNMSTTSDFSSSDGKRLLGQVKWFNNKAGYGFITVSDGEQAGKDIFIHFSSISASESQYKYLVQGEYVEFVLDKSTTDSHEFQATQVSGVKGGKLMCETRRIASLNADGSERPRSEYRKYRVRRDERDERDDRGEGETASTTVVGYSAPVVSSSGPSGPSGAALTDGDFTKVERKPRGRPASGRGSASGRTSNAGRGGRGGKKVAAAASSSSS